MKTTIGTQAITKAIHRTFEGVVVSAKEQKTVHVKIEMLKTEPKYQKKYKVHKTFAVHDETGIAHEGDIVEFQECRPLSKTKRWRISRLVKKAV